MATGSTIVSLGVDATTGLEKRAVFSRLICSDLQKNFLVEYREQLISPTGAVVSDRLEFMVSADEAEYEQFDASVGAPIRVAIEASLKNRYGIV